MDLYRLSSENVQCSSLHFPLGIIPFFSMRRLGHREVKEQTEATQTGRVPAVLLTVPLLPPEWTGREQAVMGREDNRSLV